MATAIMIVLGLIVVAEVVVWCFVRPRDADEDSVVGGHHLWAVARANTRDGVTANIQVEVTVSGLDKCVAVPSAEVVDALQAALRRRIVSSDLAGLPSLGDDPEFTADELPHGIRLDHSVVSISDVEVTPELRRLVSSRRMP